MSPRPHRPAKSCSSHNRFLLNYRLPVRGSRARPMVSRSRPSIWYPPCTRQSLHKAVRHINAAAATRKDKVGRPTMFRTARLSQAVTGVVGEKTARARGAIEEHPRNTRERFPSIWLPAPLRHAGATGLASDTRQPSSRSWTVRRAVPALHQRYLGLENPIGRRAAAPGR